ncbi:hypothetical protein C3943_04120 [Lysinibacillus sp. B2A1]|nr:hypothetical protein C3943_04120 [Lysinibacillus sp. B2A1]
MECILCKNNTVKKKFFYSNQEIYDKYNLINNKFSMNNLEKYFVGNYTMLLECTTCKVQFFDKVVPADGEFYSMLVDNSTSYYKTDRDEFDFAIQKILDTDAKKILEIGAGNGHFADRVQEVFDIYVTELNPHARNKLIEKGHKLDSKGNTYDFIVSFQVLEHIKDPNLFLTEIVNKLDRGGYIFLSVPNDCSDYSEVHREAPLNLPPHHMSRWNKAALNAIGEIFNLEVIEYYEEILNIKEYDNLVDSIRREIPLKGLFDSFEDTIKQKELINIISRTILPLEFMKKKYTGHSHGILLKK